MGTEVVNLDTLAWRVEEACLNAWPSPRQVLLGSWLLRFSGGATRRTNSVNPLPAPSHDLREVLADAEALYCAQGLPTLFRVLSMTEAMDAPLEALGYTAEGETRTLFADIGRARLDWDGEVDLTAKPSNDWLAAKARLTPLPEDHQWIYEAMIGAIVSPKAFSASYRDGQIVSVAYGVVHDRLLVVESVATDPLHRGKGLGRRTVGKLMDWASGQGAQGACLQVVADNIPALALYKSLGFERELYRYHYRRSRTGPDLTLTAR